MFKWYGDLDGSETVKVTPPTPNGVDTLQGIGAVDEQNRRATVLWGGTDNDVALDLSGLDSSIFGDKVDVEIRENALTGAEGLAGTPRVVAAYDGVALTDGQLQLDVSTYDRYAGYQLVITPDQTRDVEAGATAQAWQDTIEAEDMNLTGASVYTQDPQANGGWQFLASGGRDVGSFNQVGSRAEWNVEVPSDGTYRLQVIGGAPGVPGRHALFVDDESAGTVQYAADLALNANSKWKYRGSAEVLVDLTAGSHTLSIRSSANGTSVLPNSDVTLDKVSLTSVEGGEPTLYPASGFRLEDGASLTWDGNAKGGATISGDGRADLYATAIETGYYDVQVDWASTKASSVELTVNGAPVTEVSASKAGKWRSNVTVHLNEGINEIELRSPDGAVVQSLTTIRDRAADDAAVSVDAEDMTLHGEASVTQFDESTGTNASGGTFAGWIGNGTANAVEIARDGFAAAGDYDLTVYYANAETSGQHDYNPQVVDRLLEVQEGGEAVGHAYFRYTYSWDSFSQRTIPVTLSTADESLRLGNASAWAPNIDRVDIAPRVIGDPTTTTLKK